MGELSEEATKLIKVKCEEFFAQERSLLTELNLYRWALRALFVVVLGGSVFGIIKAQDYLDDIVARHVQKQDDLYSGAVLTAAGDSRGALERLDSFVNNVGTDKGMWDVKDVSVEQRSFLLFSLLTALSSIEDMDINGEFIGKGDWTMLLDDPVFRNRFLISNRWESDARFNIIIGLCYLHFAENTADIETARRYFIRSGETPYIDWYLGVISFVMGDKQDAIEKLNKAIDWKLQPESYRNYDATEILRTIDWNIFTRLWTKIYKTDFGTELKTLFVSAENEHRTVLANKRIAAIDIFNTEEKRNNFVTLAEGLYVKFRSAWRDKDAEVLRKLLSTPVYSYYTAYVTQHNSDDEFSRSLGDEDLDALLSAKLSDASQSAGHTLAVVTFTFKKKNSIGESNNSPTAEGVGSVVRSFEFSRRRDDEDAEWVLVGVPVFSVASVISMPSR
jgi:hypothetical protein